MTYKSPYRKDSLEIKESTKPEHVQNFVERRSQQPIDIGGKTIWNFNNHKVERKTITMQLGNLMCDKYIIPYQISGVWAVMYTMLPEEIRNAEILTWSSGQGRYVAFPNYYRRIDKTDNDEFREKIREWLEQNR